MKQAEREKLIIARQKEIRANGLLPKRRQRNENGERLERKFNELVDKANEILDKFEQEKHLYIFTDDYGALFYDKTIMTQNGRFRKNASELSISELEERNKILNTFINDSPSYEKEAEAFEKFAEKVFENDEDYNSKEEVKKQYNEDFFNFILYDTSLVDSQDMTDTYIYKSESNGRKNLGQIRQAFIEWNNRNKNIDNFIAEFSENKHPFNV